MSYIRKVFALRKTDDVRKYVVRREIKKGDKTFFKSPKIQRLITEKRIRRKKLYKKSKLDAYKKTKEDKAKYDKVLSKYIKEKKAEHHKEHDAKIAAKTGVPVAEAKKAAPVKEVAKQAPVKVEAKKAAPAKQAPKKK